MTASFPWNIRRSLSSPTWEPQETPPLDADKFGPDRFWKCVDMFKDDDDFDISDDGSGARGTFGKGSDYAHQSYHFELDPTLVFDQEEFLGHGQLGSVAKMKIRGSDIVFACKTSTTPPRVKNLRQEADLLRNLDHEHIVKFIGTFTPPAKNSYLSLIMRPVGEQNLEEFLRGTESSVHRPWLQRWFLCLASALRYLHEKKEIRHEDIKPSNIILRGDKIFFTDFGSSTICKSEITTSTESPGYGTPMYEAPEVLYKEVKHGTRSDIFSLGCVYVELLAAMAHGHIHELHNFCKEQSTKGNRRSEFFLYSSVAEHLDSWFANLHSDLEITVVWKGIVRHMLRKDRKGRPTAGETFQLLEAGLVPFMPAKSRLCCRYEGLKHSSSSGMGISASTPPPTVTTTLFPSAKLTTAEEEAKEGMKNKSSVRAAPLSAERESATTAEESKIVKEEAEGNVEEKVEENAIAKEEAEKPAAEATPHLAMKKRPIKFKDAVGRNFSFPWHICCTWKGMEELIKQSFLHVGVLSQHVQNGHYYLLGPDGEMIKPHLWDVLVQPGWTITMHMWPMQEPISSDLPPSPPAVPAHTIETLNHAPPHESSKSAKPTPPQANGDIFHHVEVVGRWRK